MIGLLRSVFNDCKEFVLWIIAALFSDTLFIFDWDDTLCPTSIISERLRENIIGDILEDLQEELVELQEAVIDLLRKCKKHGRVKIVSNGNRSWLIRSSRLMMPAVGNFLRISNIPMLPTDEYAPGTSRNNRKPETFRRIVRNFKRGFLLKTKTNAKLFSVGDAVNDRAATLLLAFGDEDESWKLDKENIRFIKMNPITEISDLTQQINLLNVRLLDILEAPGLVNIPTDGLLDGQEIEVQEEFGESPS